MAVINGSETGTSLPGTADADTIHGNGGNDTIQAMGGADVLYGDAGDDVLNGGAGPDTIYGGADADTFVVDFPSDLVSGERWDGGSGNDTISVQILGPVNLSNVEITDIEFLSADHDDITISAGQLNAMGGSLVAAQVHIADGGHVDLTTHDWALNSAHVLLSDEGNDLSLILGEFDSVLVVGGASADIISASMPVSPSSPYGESIFNGEGGNDSITGSGQKDSIGGDAGDDTLDGGGGNDTLVGGGGNDQFHGGEGSDLVDFSSASAGVTVDLSTSVVQNTGVGMDLFDSIENIIGSIYADRFVASPLGGTIQGYLGDDTLTGGVGADYLLGGGGDDSLVGGGGDDTLIGGNDQDTMTGGGGDDTYYVESNSDIVTELPGQGFDTVHTSGSFSLLGAEIEVLQASDAGSTKSLQLRGNEYNQLITASNGADTIDGGGGADTMSGLGGNDTYYVDDVGDRVIEYRGAGTDSVHASISRYVLPNYVERLYFDDTGDHVARGNSDSNLIYGNAGLDKFIIDAGGADTFSGGAGEDSFDGRTSAEAMTLRLDDQSMNAGSVVGDTFASVEKFFGSDTAADAMTTGAARAKFFGYGGNDTLTGGSSIDALSGGAGNDSLIGNAGQDALDGGVGDDTMTGGAGKDTFTFVDAAFGKDVITDYEDGVDRLKIFSAVADDFSDFSVAGNGSHHVVLTLVGATANTITLDNASANITVTAADFLFY